MISNLTMVCYHQSAIRRTLGLTISPFSMMTNLGYLGDQESPLKPIMDQQLIFKNLKQDDQDILERIATRNIQCESSNI